MRRLLVLLPLLALVLAGCETEPMSDADSGAFDATLRGKGECTASYTVTWWFEYGTTASGEWKEGPHHDENCPGATPSIALEDHVIGLTDGTQYRYRLCAQVGTNPKACYDSQGTQGGTSYDTFTTDTATTVERRKNEVMTQHITNPQPSLNDFDDTHDYQGRANLALASYYMNTNLDQADDLINQIHDDDFPKDPGLPMLISDDGAMSNDPDPVKAKAVTASEWSFAQMVRMALGKDLHGTPMVDHMSSTARSNLYDILWRTIRTRSRVADAGSGNAWSIYFTENHNAMFKSAYLLASKALLGAGAPYGPGQSRNVLADGHTLQEHYDAWKAYWNEYFYQRMREGLNIERGSPGYEGITIQVYYNIMDLVGDPTTSGQARKFLDLYWGNVANEYAIGAGIHTVAGAREYQTGNSVLGTGDWARSWFYIDDWSSAAVIGRDDALFGAMSPYQPPAIVRAIATNEGAHKSADNPLGYSYVARQWGRTQNIQALGPFLFPSSIMRSVYWTPEYEMGAVAYDGNAYNYAQDSSQNRYSAVIFNSGVNDRLVIQGIGRDPSTQPEEYAGITAYAREGVLVAARDHDNKELFSDPSQPPELNQGVRIFVPDGNLRDHLVTNGAWLFTYSGNAYCGIRIATGGSAWGDQVIDWKGSGQWLNLGDPWSPIVIQCGRQGSGNRGPNGSSITYQSFADFQDKVVSNAFSYSGTTGQASYTGENGRIFGIQKQNSGASNTLPTLEGNPINLNPPNVWYDSSYIKSSTQDSAVLSYPGYPNYTINFGY